jgi:hypothetical protein
MKEANVVQIEGKPMQVTIINEISIVVKIINIVMSSLLSYISSLSSSSSLYKKRRITQTRIYVCTYTNKQCCQIHKSTPTPTPTKTTRTHIRIYKYSHVVVKRSSVVCFAKRRYDKTLHTHPHTHTHTHTHGNTHITIAIISIITPAIGKGMPVVIERDRWPAIIGTFPYGQKYTDTHK